MIDPVEAGALLRRWDRLLHKHGEELEALREAGVGERRIHSLYPLEPSDYTDRLCLLLGQPQSFSQIYRLYKADKASLYSSHTGWSLWQRAAPTPPFPISITLRIGPEQTAELESSLLVNHAQVFGRWVRASHEFCANLYFVPQLLHAFSTKDIERAYHFTLGSAKKAKEFSDQRFAAEVERLLTIAAQHFEPVNVRPRKRAVDKVLDLLRA